MSAIGTLAQEIPVHSAAEVVDKLKDNTGLIAGKTAATSLGTVAAGTTFGYGGLTYFTLPVIGLSAAVSASITQIEHQRNMKRVAKFYQKELGAMLEKDPKKIDTNDLETAAHGSILHEHPANPVIAEELIQSKRRRNLGVALSAVASVATVAILGVALASGAAETAGAIIQNEWVKRAAKAIISLGTYYAVKNPMHWIGDKLFGLDEQTTHEKIEALQRERDAGRVIGKEQVFGVFVAANPDLERVIRNKFRKSYDALPITDKKRLTHDMGRLMEVDKITQAINGGTMRMAELAFVAVGQESRALPPDIEPEEKAQGIIGKVKEKLHDVAEHLTQKEEKPEHSFAERVKRNASEDMTHLERLEASRKTGPHPTER